MDGPITAALTPAMNPSRHPEGRSPQDEIQKRFAEAGAGITAAKHAVGLEDHRGMLHAHQRRVDQGHALMMFPFLQKLGIVPPNFSQHFAPPKEEDMGGITITGDITIEQPTMAPRNGQSTQPPVVTQPTQPQAPTGMSPLAKAGIGAALAAAILGGPLATYLIVKPDKPTAPAASSPPASDKDTSLTIEGH